MEAGRIRLVFVADEIPSSPLKIVEFMNEQMDPCEVLAVELRRYLHEESGETLRTLVPRVLGLTARARKRKRVTRMIDDPGIYILAPMADLFQSTFGMRPRRRMHRKGWIRMDHPEGIAGSEWLVYQDRRRGRLHIHLDGGSSPLSEATQKRILTGLHLVTFPEGVEIESGMDNSGKRFITLSIPGFSFDDDSNWDKLRALLLDVMKLFLDVVFMSHTIPRHPPSL